MALIKKIARLALGVSAVAVTGVAMAQGVPPNPFVANHALAAGQQSTFLTPMGVTGVLPVIDTVQVAEITTVQPVAVVEPAPVVVVEQPAPVIVEQPRQEMGAAPAPAPAPVIIERAPMPMPRADRG